MLAHLELISYCPTLSPFSLRPSIFFVVELEIPTLIGLLTPLLVLFLYSFTLSVGIRSARSDQVKETKPILNQSKLYPIRCFLVDLNSIDTRCKNLLINFSSFSFILALGCFLFVFSTLPFSIFTSYSYCQNKCMWAPVNQRLMQESRFYC